ncbi:MAG: O-antigen ligase family protein [Pseudomonadales bacterium]|nr:O-antigen ligase family protein [Pseudomonadales bacterium]
MSMAQGFYQKESLFKNVPFFTILTGLYIIICFLHFGERFPSLGAMRIQFIVGGVLCVMAIITLPKHKKVDSNGVLTVTYLLIVYLSIYCVFSYDRELSIDVYINKVLKFSALALFINAFCRTTKTLQFFLVCMFFAWLKLGQEGFWGWFTGSMMWENQGIQRLHGSVSIYRHPNSFSGFAVGTLPFLFFIYPVLTARWHKLIFQILGLFVLLIILTTGSRTGYVATCAFLGYYVYGLKIGKAKAALVLILLAGIAVISIPQSYKDRFTSIYTLEEAEGNSSGTRLEIIEDSWQVFKANPMGVGVGAFPTVREKMFGRTQDTHNLYLEILTNIGPLGLLLFFIFIRKVMKLNKDNILKNRQLLKQMEIDSDSPSHREYLDRRFLIAVSNAVIGYLWVRLILGLFGMDFYEIYWWLALGLTLSVNVITNKELTT